MKKVLFILLHLVLLINISFAEETVINQSGVLRTDVHGFFSVEDYYSADSSSAYDFHFLTTRMRLDARNIYDRVSFHFDGRERNRLSSKDYNSNIKSERIDLLNMDYMDPSNRFYIAAGRLLPKELFIERVDGFNFVYGSSEGVGVFGGLRPDPYTGGFNSELTTAGAYLFYRSDIVSANLAFTYNGNKGKTDREYIYSQVFYTPMRELRLYGTITADINQSTNNLDITNAIAEISYRPDFQKGVTVGFSKYQAIQMFQSMPYDIIRNPEQSYYIRGDYRFLEKYTAYGRYEHKSRDYISYNTELRQANIFQLGVRGYDLVESGVNLDLSAIMRFDYSSQYFTYSMEWSRLNWEILQLILNGSYTQSKYELTDSTDDIFLLGVSGYVYYGRNWNMSLSYEWRGANDYSTNTLMTRISYKF